MSQGAVPCPQCNKAPNGALNRLVKDACGHQKCRMCLLLDEEKCQQCDSAPGQPQSVIKFENSQGVITCNGTPKKNDTGPNNHNNGTALKAEVKTETGIDCNVSLEAAKDKLKGNKLVAASLKKKPKIVVPPHITVTKDPVQYKCNICNKEFFTKANVKYHIYCTGQTKPYSCSFCPRDFIMQSHLNLHMLKHTGKKPFTCAVCQKSFGERSKLKRHSILHTFSKPFVCSACGKAFRGNEALKLHTLIHRGEKPYTCPICDARFSDTSNLKKHRVSHSQDKVHMCDQCGKRFKLKWALTVHRRSHLRERPFECTNCSKSFVNNKELQRHQLTHLETKAFYCSICMTSFRRKDNLQRHVKNAHPGKKTDAAANKTVKQLIVKKPKPNPPPAPLLDVAPPLENPNAIKVITVSPSCKVKPEDTPVSRASGSGNGRTGTVINGPLKLAFKTSAFKNNYNIKRDYDYTLNRPYDMTESLNICQKILSPHSPPTAKKKLTITEPTSTSTEICQKILSPFPTRPVHYETSFEHKKHAIIKNIKFKLPANYTNLKMSEPLKEVIPLTPVKDMHLSNSNSLPKPYVELKPAPSAATSVIVNSLNQSSSNLHWRRRTLQNLCSSKATEN